jgi:hypothetical protein
LPVARTGIVVADDSIRKLLIVIIIAERIVDEKLHPIPIFKNFVQRDMKDCSFE